MWELTNCALHFYKHSSRRDAIATSYEPIRLLEIQIMHKNSPPMWLQLLKSKMENEKHAIQSISNKVSAENRKATQELAFAFAIGTIT